MRCYDDAHRKQPAAQASHGFTVGLLVTLIGLVFFSTVFMVTSANSNDLEKYHKVVVEAGDTLWELAENYVRPEDDIRILISQIRKINDLDSAEIHPGQIILIPAS